MEKPVITAKGLSKQYHIGDVKYQKTHGLKDLLLMPYRIFRGLPQVFHSGSRNTIWALKDINFDVFHGERIGIIGKNGAGKSTLLKILSRLVYPTSGEVIIRGRVTSLLEVGTGFNQSLTGRENIYLNASLYGLKRNEINDKIVDIVEFSGVEKFIDTPVKYYSSGMYMRLAFSVAAHLDPDILLLDEVLAVGDMAFQKKCLKTIDGLASGGRTIIFVSHSLGEIVRFCDKTIWIEDGRIIEYGPSKTVVAAYSKRMMKLQAAYHSVPEVKPKDGGDNKENKQTADSSRDKMGGDKPHPESPGAELVSFKITDDNGNVKELFMRNETINISVIYRVLRDDIPLVVNVHLHKDGVHVLTSHHDKFVNFPKYSLCHARMFIPAEFLNRGVYDFSIAIVTPTRPITKHVKLDHILSLQVADEFDQKQIFSGNYRGVVRPQFLWEYSVLKNKE